MKKYCATRVYILVLIGSILMLVESCKKNDENKNPISSDTVTDIDGNVYHTVIIGTQVWLVENLKTTKYRNGDSIPNVQTSDPWTSLNTGAYCNYNYDLNNVVDYGRLYNWFAVIDSRQIAPEGWHVPSDAEWSTLINFLGGDSIASGKLKESGTLHWITPNEGATNESGFTARPGGIRNDNYFWVFSSLGFIGNWWSTTELENPYGDSGDAYGISLINNPNIVLRGVNEKTSGKSVRCIKD